MSNEPNVSLREYFEKIIELQRAANERALQIQYVEIERRLADLNRLRAEVVEDRERFVPRQVYEPGHKDLEAWRLATNERITTIETRSVTWTAAIGIFFTILQLIMAVTLYVLRNHP